MLLEVAKCTDITTDNTKGVHKTVDSIKGFQILASRLF